MRRLNKTWSRWALIVMLFPAILSGQGLLLDDEAYNKLPRQPVYGDGSKSENDLLKDKPKIDLRPYCPTPQHQGAISSCTGWAAGYGAMTILESIRQHWNGHADTITASAYSALFVYNQVKAGSCDAGADIGKAAALLCNKGNLRSKEFDRIKNNCDKQPNEDELRKASANRIKDFVTLFSTDDPSQIKIEKTKLSLAQKKPVVIGMLLRNNFQQIRRGEQFWRPDTGDTTFLGAHAMVVVGYDDGKEAFEILNSWGPSWGNGGFIWVKYTDFARFCCYGFQFIPYDDPDQNRPYNARIQLRTPIYNADDSWSFEDEELLFNGKYYELKRGAVPRNYLTQLFFPYITEDAYLYAFSYDASRKIKIHWPRDGNLDAQFSGKNESAIIAFPEIKLAVPAENGALIFESKGADHICILVARQPLERLNKQLQDLQKLPPGDFLKNLYSAFGNDLVPQREVEYMTDMAGFAAFMRKGKAVPVVVRVRVE